MLIDLCWLDRTGVIILCKSGVIYTNQTGGIMCDHPEAEGVYVPLPDMKLQDDARFLNSLGKMELQQLQKYLDELPSIYGKIETMWKGEKQSEAWVEVEVRSIDQDYSVFLEGFDEPVKGILTWPNSD